MSTPSFTLTKDLEKQLRFSIIPQVSLNTYSRNIEKSESNNADHICAYCGKEIVEPVYYINTAFGGDMYIPIDDTVYNDTWIMPVGNTCVKRFNQDYIFKYEDLVKQFNEE